MNTVLLRIAAATLVATCCVSVSVAQDKTQQNAPTNEIDGKPDLQSRMLGAWLLAGKPGTKDEPKRGARMKFFGHRHWIVTQADPDTGEVIFHHGGTYELDGNKLVTKVLFATDSTASLIGTENRFTITVEGDTYTQIGVGNPWSEAWKRASK